MTELELHIEGLSDFEFNEIKTILSNEDIAVARTYSMSLQDDLVELVFSKTDAVDYVKGYLYSFVLDYAKYLAKKTYTYLRKNDRHVQAIWFDFPLRVTRAQVVSVSVLCDGETIDEAISNLDPALAKETIEDLQKYSIFDVQKFKGVDVHIWKM